ncbi:YacL family protein [Neptunicella sp.]|uniref:UPF0231 family protein n=1 Tax=Neptunicella sp. TaxID=2125986 RepID=UPI003F692D1B
MEYQFTRNDNAKPVAHFSMGAEAFGRWFSDELATHSSAQHLLLIIAQLEQRQIDEYRLVGQEFVLNLSQDEVDVISKDLLVGEQSELPEGTEYYDQEHQAGCGLADFKQALLSWSEFIGG